MKHIVFISVLFAILFVSLYLYNRPMTVYLPERFDGEIDMDEINKQTTPMEIDKVNPISKRVKNELTEKIRALSGSQPIAEKATATEQSKEISKEKSTSNDIDYSQYIHKSRLEDIEKEIKEKIEKYYIPKESLPDMSKYVLKTEIPSCPKVPSPDKYILKTQVPVCSPPVDLSKYMLKTEIPPCVVPGDDKTVFPVDKMVSVFRNPIEQGSSIWKSPYA